MRRVHLLACAAGIAVSLAGAPASAARIQVGEDAFLEVKLLLQVQGQLRERGAPNGTDTNLDFFLRRGRLILLGNATKNLSFFVDTDSPNIGKGGDFTPSIYVQDAFASYRLLDALNVDAGLIITPLTHQSVQGAVSLNTLDYHAFLFKYPKDSNKVWRDVGLQLRGLFLNDRLQYRVGVFGGVRGKTGRKDDAGNALPSLNPSGVPRFAGMLRLNFLDPEPDFFFSGTYFRKKKVVSIGVGGDYQNKAVAAGKEVNPHAALAGDVFVDLPVGQASEIVAQVDVVNYWQGDLASGTGFGLFGEAGYRWKMLGAVVGYDRFFSHTGAGDYQALHLGLNWWINGHGASVKADLAFERDAAAQKVADLWATRNATVFTLQTQLYF